MLKELVEALSAEQRDELHEFGVDRHLLSRWRTGTRVPTEAQTAFLAAITGVDYRTLSAHVAELRMTPAQRSLYQRALGKVKRGAGVMLSFGAGAAVAFAAAYDRVATMYRGKNG